MFRIAVISFSHPHSIKAFTALNCLNVGIRPGVFLVPPNVSNEDFIKAANIKTKVDCVIFGWDGESYSTDESTASIIQDWVKTYHEDQRLIALAKERLDNISEDDIIRNITTDELFANHPQVKGSK